MKKRIKIILPFVLIIVIVSGILSLSIRPEYSGVDYSPADTQNNIDKTIKLCSTAKSAIISNSGSCVSDRLVTSAGQ